MTLSIPGYRILAELGSGASGTVYKAVQEGLGREVALKLLAPGLFDARETRARFLREAKLQAGLSHPALLALYDFGFAGERPFLVTELAAGGTLRDKLAGRGLSPLREALRVGREIALGLEAAHGAGVVHRDLKPENVLLTADGQPKVCDFGLAKADRPGQTVKTQAGVILGTPGYIAPEAILGRSAGPPADIYALGVLLYETICGSRPFEGASASEVIRAQLDGVATSLRQRAPGVSLELETLVLSCLATEPGNRPRSAGEVARRLVPVESEAPVEPLDESKRTAVRAMPSGLRRPAALGTSRQSVAARAPVATVAGRQAAQVSAESPRPGLRAAFVLALVTLAAAAFTSSTRRQAPAPVPAAASPAAPAEAPAGAAANRDELAGFLRRTNLAAGGDRVRLRFAGKAPVAIDATATTTSPPADEKSVRVAADARELEIPGLQPNTLYQCRLSAAGATNTTTFRTLEVVKKPALLVIVRPVPGLAFLRVAASGDSVVAILRREMDPLDHRILGIWSADRGETWSPPLELSAGPRVRVPPTIAAASGAIMAGWAEGDGYGFTNPASLVRSFDVASARWEKSESFPGGTSLGVAAVEAPAGGFLLMLGMPPAGVPLGRMSWDARGHGPLLPCDLSQTVGRLLLTRAAGHPVALLDNTNSNAKKEILCSRGIDPEGARWASPVKIATTRTALDEVDLCAEGNTVCVVYRSHRRVQVACSPDAGRSFPVTTDPFPTVATGKAPTLVAAGGTFHLLTLDQGQVGERYDLAFARSTDGVRWESEGRVVMPLDYSRGARLAAFPDRLLAFVLNDRFGLVCLRRPLGPGK
ncbi:MAG: serine/threonine protein kinase [Candidatus Wallbacteria bacterium]|nr:serine/threonine protein kinase [Candidatus Wallbacteria bacterium]